MNRPTQFLLIALFVAAGSALALATSAMIHTLAEFPQPLPFPVTSHPQVVTIYDLHDRPVGTATVQPSRPAAEFSSNGQLIPTEITSTTELLPTHWDGVKNLLVHR